MKTLAEREWFYSQEKIPLPSEKPEAGYNIYQLKTTGQIVCEIVVDLGVGDDSVEIAQVTDCHLNLFMREDADDPETPYTDECRKSFRNAMMLESTMASLEAAEYSDAMVATGDILDYISHGSVHLAKKYVVDAHPDIMMTVAWHDMTKQLQTKRANLLTNGERMELLTEFWPHDIHYYARDIGRRVRAICLGQTLVKYSSDIRERLLADIESARAEGRYILIFQHEPLSTRNEADREVTPAFTRSGGYGVLRNFCDAEKLMCKPGDPNEINNGVYDIITSNADVIKGLFVGHYHSQFYTKLDATMTVNGKCIKTFIPQHVASFPCLERGYIARIIVK